MVRAMTMLPAFSLVIPVFNEADRIGRTLREMLEYLHGASPESEVIVVNDGSTDATSEVVREVLEAETKIETRLLEKSPNRGKGATVRRWSARSAKTDRLVFRRGFVHAPRGNTEAD